MKIHYLLVLVTVALVGCQGTLMVDYSIQPTPHDPQPDPGYQILLSSTGVDLSQYTSISLLGESIRLVDVFPDQSSVSIAIDNDVLALSVGETVILSGISVRLDEIIAPTPNEGVYGYSARVTLSDIGSKSFFISMGDTFTVEVGSASHTISFLNFSLETNEILLSVDGVQQLIGDYQSVAFGDVLVYAKDLFLTNIPAEHGSAILILSPYAGENEHMTRYPTVFLTIGQPVSVLIDSELYVVELFGANAQTQSLVLSVNGNRRTVSEGDEVIIAGLALYVTDVFVTEIPALDASARVYLRPAPVVSYDPSVFLRLGRPVSFMVEGVSYDFELVGANAQTQSLVLSVNGNRRTVSEGDEVIIAGLALYVTDVFVTEIPAPDASAIVYVRRSSFSVGSNLEQQELFITSDDPVTLSVDGNYYAFDIITGDEWANMIELSINGVIFSVEPFDMIQLNEVNMYIDAIFFADIPVQQMSTVIVFDEGIELYLIE